MCSSDLLAPTWHTAERKGEALWPQPIDLVPSTEVDGATVDGTASPIPGEGDSFS